jgi:hypothetical protein
MEELLLVAGQLLLDLLGQIVLEVLWDLGLASFKVAFQRPSRSLPLAVAGLFFLGGGIGGISLLIWPGRILGPGPLPGLSLILGPLCAGLAMQAWGRYRRNAGHVTTGLATFPGGAAFALGTALVRFVWAG